ncbi:phage major capsid protein [Roseimicrobium sp. ORNL1]|uniref:phage major capsid protein n=1 Tax=Roseimicrobium sp. ORNL1 TaxID=2711231 RepID=UPI0013E14716|nr:phage major capsid protein [Roseimicrobium sp. ORNL1]QIF05755.1 phage major capsid protein [Roseimicrobium sp. ORNL1]
MKTPHRRLLLVIVPLLLITGSLPAQQDMKAIEATMGRMRDALRNTMIQLQTAQAENAASQAKLVEAENKIVELNARITSLTKQADADKANATRVAKEQEARIGTQATELAALSSNLEKWKAGYKQAADVANQTESRRAKSAAKVIVLERRVADQQVKNQELYKLGLEVLTRYEKFGLGTAIVRREPFTGIARAKFETLVQDYSDKLADGRIKPEDAEKSASAAAAAASAAPASAPVPATPSEKPAEKPAASAQKGKS